MDLRSINESRAERYQNKNRVRYTKRAETFQPVLTPTRPTHTEPSVLAGSAASFKDAEDAEERCDRREEAECHVGRPILERGESAQADESDRHGSKGGG